MSHECAKVLDYFRTYINFCERKSFILFFSCRKGLNENLENSCGFAETTIGFHRAAKLNGTLKKKKKTIVGAHFQ